MRLLAVFLFVAVFPLFVNLAAAKTPREAELVREAEILMSKTMPIDEKIERLEAIESEIRSIRNAKSEPPTATPTSEPFRKGRKAERPADVSIPETARKPDVQDPKRGEDPKLVARLAFFVGRFWGYAIAFGLLAAAVFVMVRVFETLQERVVEFARTRTFPIRNDRRVPRDGTVPSYLR